MFPVVPGGKKPLIPKCPIAKAKGLVGNELADHARTCSRSGHGLHDATTDPRKIHMWWRRWPNANIGMPTGERSGVWGLDEDRPGAVEKLEREHGPIPPTLKVKTPRGGQHLYFRHTEGVTNSSGGLPEGIDVRGQGGYVLVPPSTGYRVERREEVAEAPGWLLGMVRERASQPREKAKTSHSTPEGGETIPEGSRNSALFFEALRLKDAGKDVLAGIEATNAERCSPPLGSEEVSSIARSAMRYPVRSGTPSPEVLEAVEKLEEFWWSHLWPGMGGKTDRDVYRVLIELARRYGKLLEDGSVSVSASVRSVALAAATTFVTVSGGATKRLARAGLARKTDGERKAAEAATWVLAAPPRQVFNTQQETSSRENMPCVKGSSRPRLWDLSTPAFRWTGHVKKGRAGVLYVLEAHGPLRLEELAECMGWTRARDLRARYVDPLIKLGLVEDHGGVLALPGDHAEKVEEIRRAPYTTVRLRRRESKDSSGRMVRWVEETECTASEVEREQKDDDDHKKHREGFKLYLAQRGPEADEACRKLLNALDDERWFPDGEIRELESIEPCIHDVPGDPSMRMTRAECWLCRRKGA